MNDFLHERAAPFYCKNKDKRKLLWCYFQSCAEAEPQCPCVALVRCCWGGLVCRGFFPGGVAFFFSFCLIFLLLGFGLGVFKIFIVCLVLGFLFFFFHT